VTDGFLGPFMQYSRLVLLDFPGFDSSMQLYKAKNHLDCSEIWRDCGIQVFVVI
jgi:hypothetical protein